MKGYFKKDRINGTDCLVPANIHTAEDLKKLKFNRGYKVEAKTPRNLPHTAKYYCLLKEIEQYTDIPTKELHRQIKFKTGHYEIVGEIEGHYITEVKSIAFHEMNQEEFEDFYDRALDVMIGDTIGLNLTKEQIDDLANKAYNTMENFINRKVVDNEEK